MNSIEFPLLDRTTQNSVISTTLNDLSNWSRLSSLPFWPVVGEEGFEPPTPWFIATCSNPLSYRPHPVSTGSVSRSTLKLKKGNLPSPQPFHFGLRRCESASLSLSIRTVRSEV
ncbi:hypothetical protein HN873_032948 [Arachis hypogaea]